MPRRPRPHLDTVPGLLSLARTLHFPILSDRDAICTDFSGGKDLAGSWERSRARAAHRSGIGFMIFLVGSGTALVTPNIYPSQAEPLVSS